MIKVFYIVHVLLVSYISANIRLSHMSHILVLTVVSRILIAAIRRNINPWVIKCLSRNFAAKTNFATGSYLFPG